MGFIDYICKRNKIKVVAISDLSEEGQAIIKDSVGNIEGVGWVLDLGDEEYSKTILFDDTREQIELNHIILHELGHILLGHTTTAGQRFKNKELEANVFAATILAHALYDEYKEESIKKAVPNPTQIKSTEYKVCKKILPFPK